MAPTDFGTLFFDTPLRIKCSTPRLTDFFNVTPNDKDRSITGFMRGLVDDDMADRARADRAVDSRSQR